MPKFEYRVVPAPRRAVRVKGLRTTEDRFAHALEVLMNEMGAEGWEYVRADILPCEERAGLSGRRTVYQNMLVFRRFLGAEEDEAPRTARVLGVVEGGLAGPAAANAASPGAAAAADGDAAGQEPADPRAPGGGVAETAAGDGAATDPVPDDAAPSGPSGNTQAAGGDGDDDAGRRPAE